MEAENSTKETVTKKKLNRHGLPDELIAQLVGEIGPDSEKFYGAEGLLKRLVASVTEKLLETEMTEHVGYEKHLKDASSGNARNGYSAKTVRSEFGPIELSIPRDREGTFEPRAIKKHQRQMNGFDEKIVAMYGLGLSDSDIQKQLKEMYGTEVSTEFISRATDSVLEELRAWRSRPLEAVYPIVYLDALVIKVRENGTVHNKSLYLAIGYNLEGQKEVMGMWMDSTEGAKFWLSCLTDLKNRGVEDVFIFCVDGLKGFPEAIEATFSQSIVQTCVVHIIRNSLKYVGFQHRKQVAADLRKVYTSDTEEGALLALKAFDEKWAKQYPTVIPIWKNNWERIRPFLEFPREIRRAVYTTNAIESLNYSVRKVIKTKGHFPSPESAEKLVYLALKNASEKWLRPPTFWNRALAHFHIRFEGRVR